LSQFLSLPTDLGRHSLGVLLEVPAQNLSLAQVFLKDLGTIKIPQRTLQAQAIKGVQIPQDILLVFLYERVKGVVCGSRCSLLHEIHLIHKPSLVSSMFQLGRSARLNIRVNPCSSVVINSVAALPRCDSCAS
jgi:hypothetical protein